MYAESRERAVRIVTVVVIVRAVGVDNRNVVQVTTVRANGLIPKNLFLFYCSSVSQL